MGLKNKIAQYREFRSGITHCTFNPEGPGVVRIHLVPPKFRLIGSAPYIVILNGYYMLPIGYSWAIVLSAFIKEVNSFDGLPITETDKELIFKNTISSVCKTYPSVNKKLISEDLNCLLDVLFAVAKGIAPEIEIEKLSIRNYAENMTSPHRMDLIVSSMTDESGNWKCNQKCIFCYAAGQKFSQTKELTTNEWKEIIDILYKNRVPMVTFTGGEPTQRTDLTQLVSYAKRMITRLNTNGVRLTKELTKELKNAGLDSVQITLYSHNKEIHNSLVGINHFEDTVQGIKNAVAAGLDISINTPLCKKNADYLKTLGFIKSLGVSFVTASGLICTGMAEINHNEYDLSEKELFDIIKEAKEFCDNNETEIDFTSPGLLSKEALEELGMNVPMCGACLSNMAIAPDGTVVPCQSWLNSDSSLGNILDTPFKKIWTHPTAVNLRSMSEKEALSCPFRTQKDGDTA